MHGLALLLAIVFFRAVERTGLPNPLATSDEELYIIRPIETQGTDNTMTLLTILVVLKLTVVSTDWFSALRGDVFKRFSALFSWVIFGTQVLKLVSCGKCDVFFSTHLQAYFSTVKQNCLKLNAKASHLPP